MNRARSAALLVAVFALALPLAGCGDDDEEGGDGEARPSVATVNVTETEYRLEPANPKVDKAGLVDFRVRNAGRVTHALEVETPDGEFETDEIEPGGTATLKVGLKAGTVEWYCPIGDHRERGMRGEITVAGGSGEPGAGEGEPKEEEDGGY